MRGLKPIQVLQAVSVSLEEDASSTPANDSKKTMETEVVVYCTVGKPEGLEQAVRMEDHHQIEVRFETGHTSRVRKITKDGKDVYEFTFKVKEKTDDGGQLVEGCIENTVEVDQQFFDDFKKVATRELVKTRYIFSSEKVEMKMVDQEGQPSIVTIPNVEYEVDIYKKADGQVSQFCKIDVEVDNILNFMAREFPQIKDVKLNLKISHLPFEPKDILPAQTDDEQVRERISAIWDEFARKLNEPETPEAQDT